MELLWMTNIPTPYTVPVWRELSKISDFHVACMAETEFNRDWKVDVAGLPLTILGARPVRVGAERTYYLPTRRMFHLFRMHRPGVVVLDGWESPAFWQARMLARMVGARVVLSYWSTTKTHTFSTGPIAAFRSRYFRTADGVITPGQGATDAVLAMGVPAERITTGFGTVDVERFSSAARRPRVPRQQGSGHRYLFVGQLVPRKNIDLLADAFAAMHRHDDTLTIVGTGPLENDIRTKVDALGIADQVDLRGHLDGEPLIEAYAQADTLVLPSSHEVWGLVANEALAAGLSVMVSAACGVSTSISHVPGVHIFSSAPELADALHKVREQKYEPDSQRGVHAQTPEALASLLSRSLQLSGRGSSA